MMYFLAGFGGVLALLPIAAVLWGIDWWLSR